MPNAWASRDGDALGALWDPDGILHPPLYDRTLAGAEIATLTKAQLSNPSLRWSLIGWTMREDSVVIEWQNDIEVNGAVVAWRGVDKMRLGHGRIVEETVYMDSAGSIGGPG